MFRFFPSSSSPSSARRTIYFILKCNNMDKVSFLCFDEIIMLFLAKRFFSIKEKCLKINKLELFTRVILRSAHRNIGIFWPEMTVAAYDSWFAKGLLQLRYNVVCARARTHTVHPCNCTAHRTWLNNVDYNSFFFFFFFIRYSFRYSFRLKSPCLWSNMFFSQRIYVNRSIDWPWPTPIAINAHFIRRTD